MPETSRSGLSWASPVPREVSLQPFNFPFQTGMTPMRWNIWAICSPSAYITSPAIQNIPTFSGSRPCSFYFSSRLSASLRPTIQAASVGTAEGSSEKKFLPVGRIRSFPCSSAPMVLAR